MQSRKNSELLNNLLQDNYPVLFEGFHTTYYLNNYKIKGRKSFVRAHNIEHEYYKNLFINEKS
ncbi:MAG: hypothetical protein JXB17_02335, partial [Bacteroidales bacterium]|nr:hypothetical protein [Bacteroidales bacterium]